MKLLPVILVLICFNVHAIRLKVASLAPQGTTLGDSMGDLDKEIKKATNGEVSLKIYYGGVAGDEPDVLRKIRVGQFHGGFFTGKTLGDIYGDVRTMEVPFNFNQDREIGKKVLDKMTPYFNKGLDKQGFVNLGFFEIGQVYVLTTKKAENLAAMKGMKIWSWEGDKLITAMVKALDLVAVPLALPDVLASLSTGVVHSAYAPPLGVLALQWQTKVKYLINFPIAYSVGAFLISKRQWGKVSPANQKKILAIAKKHTDIANTKSAEENVQALAALKAQGIKFLDFPKTDYAQAMSLRQKTLDSLKGNLLSPNAINLLEKYSAEK